MTIDVPEEFAKMPLPQQIAGLTRALGTATESIERGKKNQKRLFWLFIAFLVAVLVGGYFLWHSARDANQAANQATHAVHEAKLAQTQSCLNGNQTRDSLRFFLVAIIDAPPQAGDPPRTAAQQHVSDVLRQFTLDSFASRDCKDLTKRYTQPPLPDILKPQPK